MKPMPAKPKISIAMDADVAMKLCDFKSMSADKLWTLHEKITATLAKKIIAEKCASKSVFASLNWYQTPMGEA